MRITLENGVLRNEQPSGSAVNNFFDQGNFEAMKTLSGWEAARCDEHHFRAKIKGPLAVHFLLVCFVLIASWLPLAYLFSHIFLFLIGLWCIHNHESPLPVLAFIVVLVMTMLLDIIQLGIYFGPAQSDIGNSTWQFSAAMCIINLIGKPLTLVLACVAMVARTGSSSENQRIYQPFEWTRTRIYTVNPGTSQEQ